VKIRNVSMSGCVAGVWVNPGDVLEVSDGEGANYVRLGYAVEVRSHHKKEDKEDEGVVEHAVADEDVESAALTTEKVETPTKRAPGRPRKA
jgi:hypothetical protein